MFVYVVLVYRIREKKDHQLSFKQVASGFISRGYLDPTDGWFTLPPFCVSIPYCFVCVCAVFVLDTGFHVFVWVGKEATSHEKGGGLVIAHVSRLTT